MSEMNEPSVPPPAPEGGGPSAEERQWGMFAHLSSLAGFIIPFGNFVGPLVVWLMKKDTMPFVDDQGKESMNFQITVFIALLVAGLTCLVGIGFFLLPLVGLAAAIMAILAGIKANEGVPYRYPFTLRLIK